MHRPSRSNHRLPTGAFLALRGARIYLCNRWDRGAVCSFPTCGRLIPPLEFIVHFVIGIAVAQAPANLFKRDEAGVLEALLGQALGVQS